MLTITSGTTARDCDGWTRRSFLRAGALGLGGLTLSGMLRAHAHAAVGGPGGLGGAFAPFLPKGGSTAGSDMTLNVPLERLRDRRALLAQIDRIRRDVDITSPAAASSPPVERVLFSDLCSMAALLSYRPTGIFVIFRTSRSALFTASAFGNASATSGARTTTFVAAR